VEGLLSQTAQAASLLVRLSPHVVSVSVVNELTTTATKDGVLAELGSFYSGESRRILLTFSVPGVAALGLAQIATLELTYVELPDLRQHTVSVPLHVNVVPGDQAAGRIRDPEIHTEVVYQRVQKAKRSASAKLGAGDTEEALRELRAAQELVAQQLEAGVPERLAADLVEEARMLDNLRLWTEQGRHSHSAKTMSMDSTYKSRYRGRSNPTQP
jgi:Ca-activated chloride channel family protein